MSIVVICPRTLLLLCIVAYCSTNEHEWNDDVIPETTALSSHLPNHARELETATVSNPGIAELQSADIDDVQLTFGEKFEAGIYEWTAPTVTTAGSPQVDLNSNPAAIWPQAVAQAKQRGLVTHDQQRIKLHDHTTWEVYPHLDLHAHTLRVVDGQVTLVYKWSLSQNLLKVQRLDLSLAPRPTLLCLWVGRTLKHAIEGLTGGLYVAGRQDCMVHATQQSRPTWCTLSREPIWQETLAQAKADNRRPTMLKNYIVLPSSNLYVLGKSLKTTATPGEFVAACRGCQPWQTHPYSWDYTNGALTVKGDGGRGGPHSLTAEQVAEPLRNAISKLIEMAARADM